MKYIYNKFWEHHNSKNSLLKLVAIISMLVDHVGYTFFPDFSIFRIIGRIAFPIFAFNLSNGYIYTSNLKKYIFRLMIFGIISQYPYYLLFGANLNVFFILALGVFSIYLFDRAMYISLIFVFICIGFLPIDYGFYGISIILIFYYFRNNRLLLSFTIVIATLLYSIYLKSPLQLYSLLALILIYTPWKIDIHINKYFYYLFYPIHILFIVILTKII